MFLILECVSESNGTALSGSVWKGVAHPDLLTGADNRPPLECPKIGQNTKAIALVFLILECVSESNETALPGGVWKGQSSGDTFPSRSARRSQQ